MRMKRMVLIAGVIGMLASPAYAINYCFLLGQFGPTVVVPRFRLPSKGTCKVYGGYSVFDVDVVTMTACTNTAGTALRVGFSWHPGSVGEADSGGAFRDGQINLPLPLGSGFGNVTYRSIHSDGISDADGPFEEASAGPCPPGGYELP